MPVSRSTIGALSFSRLAHAPSSTAKTLVPFLYQTATIQQWKPTAYPIARRSISIRKPPEDDIPFENADELPPTLDEAASQRRTTITGSERAAFEKLYKKFSAEEQPKDDVPFADETDQIADEWYEEDDDADLEGSGESLDSVFDEVLSGLPNKKRTGKRTQFKPGHNLKKLAEDILKPELDAARKKSDVEARKQAAFTKKMRGEEKKRIQALMEAAKTDLELWQVMEREVFEPIREMKLDEENKPKARAQTSQKRKKKGTSTTEGIFASAASPQDVDSLQNGVAVPSTQEVSTTDSSPVDYDKYRRDPRIAFPNFPAHLIFLARVLRASYPSSQLPLSILPALKSLGRAPYALGATTTLYNIIIGTAWTQYSSYTYIDTLLADMDNGGIEFNLATLNLLDEILSEWNRLRKGGLGPTALAIYRMEYYTEGAKKLQSWREVAAQRLGAMTKKDFHTVKRLSVSPEKRRTDNMVMPDGRGGVTEYNLLGKKRPSRPARAQQESQPLRQRGSINTYRQGGIVVSPLDMGRNREVGDAMDGAEEGGAQVASPSNDEQHLLR
jgi:hypothetical protein